MTPPCPGVGHECSDTRHWSVALHCPGCADLAKVREALAEIGTHECGVCYAAEKARAFLAALKEGKP